MMSFIAQSFSNFGLQKSLVAGVIAVSAFMAGRQFGSVEELFIWGTEASGYTLQQIDIAGRNRTSNFDLQSVLDIEDGMPILAIDLASLKQRVEMLPWVKEARVRRGLPNRLEIDITERQPLALWQIDGKVYVIDETGTRIAPQNMEPFSNLVLLVGEGANFEAGSLLPLIADAGTMDNPIKNAVRISNRRWDFEFKNGLVLHLPSDRHDPTALLDSWQLFKQLNAKYDLTKREISAIDLRQRDRVILRLTKEGQRAIKGQEWQA